MARSLLLACFVTAAASAALLPTQAGAQDTSPLAGAWTLNRSLSELPREMGFNMDWMSTSGGDGQNTGSNASGRRSRGSTGGGGANRGSPGAFPVRRESYDDARRLQLLTAEARNPPARVTILDTPASFTITNELGQSRTLHPSGKEESIELEGVPVAVTTRRDGDRLVVLYRVEQDREVRYIYSHSANPSQLIVEVQLLEHGAGDKARRVYEPGVATQTLTSSGTAAPPAASGPQTPGTFDQRPGAELRGLKSLGILVEDLGAQAIACELNHDAIERAVSKRLADGGFTVRKNSDDDTYVYINVMTTSPSNGTCVSRYDVFLYTQGTSTLSYHDQPVLVQISLVHRGGIVSSAPPAHAAAVARGLETYVDVVISQIHDANK